MTRIWIAFQDDSTAMTPISVVSRIRRTLNPSTPRKYSAPMEGIHCSRSTNCHSGFAESYRNQSGSDTRKPTATVTLAIQRITSSCRFDTNSSTSAPASGVNRINDSRLESALLMTVSDYRATRYQVTNANTPRSVANA